MIPLTQPTGNITRKAMPLPVRLVKHCRSDIYPLEQTDTVIQEHLKCMNVRTVSIVHYDPNVPKQRKGTIARFIIIKNGKTKKHIQDNSFRKKKLVKFTKNEKLMWNQSSDS